MRLFGFLGVKVRSLVGCRSRSRVAVVGSPATGNIEMEGSGGDFQTISIAWAPGLRAIGN